MNRTSIRAALPALAILFSALDVAISPAYAISLIDTTPGGTTIGPFGEANTATYGQTITTPAVDNVLTDFTFYLNDFVDPDFVDFQANVYAWDTFNLRATGTALFTSSPLSTTNKGGADGFETFTINTGALPLSSGGSYVLLFSASNQFDGSIGHADISARTDNPYSGGGFAYFNNGNDLGSLTTTPWDGTSLINAGYDLAFKATFVPEPTSVVLFAFGGLGFFGYVWRRRRMRSAC